MKIPSSTMKIPSSKFQVLRILGQSLTLGVQSRGHTALCPSSACTRATRQHPWPPSLITAHIRSPLGHSPLTRPQTPTHRAATTTQIDHGDVVCVVASRCGSSSIGSICAIGPAGPSVRRQHDKGRRIRARLVSDSLPFCTRSVRDAHGQTHCSNTASTALLHGMHMQARWHGV
jgi:hypothetical protein